MWHFVLPERYTARNPHVPPPDPREQLLKPFPPKVYAISKRARRYNAFDIQDHFQSACSAVVYRDELLFPREEGKRQAFVCDPVHNLVHHTILTESGVTFTAARAPDEQTSEFFASTDNWCRPVMALTGPDGALWVVDMYRFMVEHPEYLPEVGKKELSPHYRLGEDRGRIYRVVPRGQAARQIPRMDRRNTIELCRAAMDSPSGWERDTAQMLLLWNKGRMGAEAKGELSGVVYGSQNPLARLQALCTLEGMGAMTPEVLVAALGDEHWAVRRQALRIAENFEKSQEVVQAALKLADDTNEKVRLQLALSVGEWKESQAGRTLGQLSLQANDPYLAAAVLSSAPDHVDAIDEALSRSDKPTGGSPLFRGLLRMATAKKDVVQVWSVLVDVLGRGEPKRFDAGQMNTVAGWLDALAARGESFDTFFSRSEVADDVRGLWKVLGERARSVVSDSSAPAELRAAAAGLLLRRGEHSDWELQLLITLLNPQVPAEAQRAAVTAMGRAPADLTSAPLLRNWASYSPELRGMVIDVLLRNDVSVAKLLDAVEAKQVAAADIDLPRRQRLLNHKDKTIKERAAKLLAESAIASNRQKVLDAWQPVLSMKGNAKAGAEVFRQNCAVCHHLGDVGQEVGPNLETVREWTGEAVLTAILDPNRQTEPKYVAYTATTNAGETIYGVVASESGGAVTMKGLDGKEHPVLRSDLKSLVSSNRTLMPDGFESSMTKQQMADLLEYLKAPERAQ
jgi:putative heme-binding domain-containing protein